MFKIFRKIALKIQSLMIGFDSLSLNESGPLSSELSPIFIVGAPRSGSTLLYQFIIRNFEVEYISNLMALFPRFILKIANLTRCSRQNYNEIRPERNGFVSGLHAPSEAGALHRFLFEEVKNSNDFQDVFNTIACLTKTRGCPVLLKNLNNTFRLQQILKIFPNARFMMITRNRTDAASSLIRSRVVENGSSDIWFGPKPQGFERLSNKSPEYQTLWQVSEMERVVSAFAQANNCRIVKINFNDLISSPQNQKEIITRDLGLRPKSCDPSKGILVSQTKDTTDSVSAQMRLALQEIEGSVSA